MGGALGKRKLNFNPRLREGGDENLTEIIGSNEISIHASAKEATKMPLGHA